MSFAEIFDIARSKGRPFFRRESWEPNRFLRALPFSLHDETGHEIFVLHVPDLLAYDWELVEAPSFLATRPTVYSVKDPKP